jgi:hypothetical protein
LDFCQRHQSFAQEESFWRLAGVDNLRKWKEASMLWTIAVLLMLLWFIGLISSYTLGGFIHILLLLAIIAVLVRIIEGRRPVF